MERILITGASGFIGSNLVYALVREKYRIILLLRDLSTNSFPDGIPCTKTYGSIENMSLLKELVKGMDTVFHTAAYISFKKSDFEKAYRINVMGTRNVLEACLEAGVARVVHLSACAVLGYSANKDVVLDEASNHEIGKDNVYAYTKKLAEEEVQRYTQKGLHVSIANIATVYGQGDRKLNSGAIITSIYKGKMRFVPPGGTSYVSIDDLIEGLLLLARKGRSGERYIFCTENMEYNILAQRIARTLKLKETKLVLPRLSYYPALLAMKGIESFSFLARKKIDLMTAQILKESYGYKYFSSKKARGELGWKPLQGLEEAVEKAFIYYKENSLI